MNTVITVMSFPFWAFGTVAMLITVINIVVGVFGSYSASTYLYHYDRRDIRKVWLFMWGLLSFALAYYMSV